MNKIIGISDGNALIPVSWKLNSGIADADVPLHNAIVMGIIMARQIDTMSLWDGTLTINQAVNPFAITPQALSIVGITEDITTARCSNGFTISQAVEPFAITQQTLSIVALLDTMPVINDVKAYNDDTTKITVEFDNPVYCSGASVLGFTFTMLVGLTSDTLIPISIEQISLNKYQFTFADFASASTLIVTYNNADGNLVDYANGNPVNYFAVTFAPTMSYSEGE